jgi:threonine/homoserine/homoserine lactone efflux protein
MLIAIHGAMGLIWLGGLAFAVSSAARFIANTRIRRMLDGAIGALMLGFGVRLALTPR